MKPFHLLIISPGFPENEDDFLCIPPLQSYLKCLKENHLNVKVSVVAMNYPAGKRTYQWHDIQVVTPLGYNPTFPKNWQARWQAWRYIQQLHRHSPIDFIHSFWLGESAFMGDLISRYYQLPHLTTLMGQDAKSSNKWLRYPFHATHQKVGLSTYQHQVTNSINLNAIVPWGIWRGDLPTLNRMERPIDILGVGSLIPLKRYDWFLAVVKQIKRQFPKLNVVLIGEGKERQQLEQFVQEERLTNTISFKGLCTRNQVLDYMNQAKIFLHTSRYESQGYVFNEALAMGMQLVSTPVGLATEQAYWALGNGIEELSELTTQKLTEWTKAQAYFPYTMQDTLTKYWDFYATS